MHGEHVEHFESYREHFGKPGTHGFANFHQPKNRPRAMPSTQNLHVSPWAKQEPASDRCCRSRRKVPKIEGVRHDSILLRTFLWLKVRYQRCLGSDRNCPSAGLQSFWQIAAAQRAFYSLVWDPSFDQRKIRLFSHQSMSWILSRGRPGETPVPQVSIGLRRCGVTFKAGCCFF